MVLLTPAELRELIKDVVSQCLEEKLPAAETVKEDQLLSISEVADFFSVTLVTIHAWSKSGLLKKYRIGSKVYFKKSEMIESLKKGKHYG